MGCLVSYNGQTEETVKCVVMDAKVARHNVIPPKIHHLCVLNLNDSGTIEATGRKREYDTEFLDACTDNFKVTASNMFQ